MTYQAALKIAYKVDETITQKPASHREWAEGFNRRHELAKLIQGVAKDLTA